MNKEVPSLKLDKDYNVIYYNESVKSEYSDILSKGYLKNLLGGYAIDYFSQPTVINMPFIESGKSRLLVVQNDDILNCYIVKNENYNIKNISAGIQYRMREPVSGVFALLPSLAANISSGDERKAVRNLEEIQLQTYKFLRSINNISMSTKILSGEKSYKDIFDFSNILQSIILGSSTIERNINITSEIDSDVYIDGSKTMMTAGILNLISNSINFKGQELPNISVKLSKKGKQAIFTYSDNSIGIKEENQSFIFRPYFSKDPYCDGEVDPSLGLGLFILKSAVEQSGGNIMLSSQFGEGVSYIISLPMEEPDTDILGSRSSDFLLDRYSQLFVQLCESCDLPMIK